MNLAVTLEARYLATPDGLVWTKGPSTRSFFEQYLSAFDGVKVIARMKQVPAVDDSYHSVSGPNITFCPIPHYIGPYQYAKLWRHVGRAVRGAIGKKDALLLRAPGALANHAVTEFWRAGRPYGIEVVGDPFDVFARGTYKHPLRPLLQYFSVRALRKQCARAEAVSYVTRDYLQHRYPSGMQTIGVSDAILGVESFTGGKGIYQTHYSSVELREIGSNAPPRLWTSDQGAKVLFIGSLEQKYKGLDVLLNALAELMRSGSLVSLTVIGDGLYRAEMEELTRSLGLTSLVRFLGEMPSGQPIREQLDRCTLLVVPSRAEGLPRVVLEGMARGVPCIASNVGGIPELLEEEDMVPADDVSALARKIKEVISSPVRLRRMSERNHSHAQDYRIELLQARRERFLRALRSRTEEWLEKQTESN